MIAELMKRKSVFFNTQAVKRGCMCVCVCLPLYVRVYLFVTYAGDSTHFCGLVGMSDGKQVTLRSAGQNREERVKEQRCLLFHNR